MNVDDIRSVAIVGSGLMGHGIALQFAMGGYEVRLNDVSEARLDAAVANIETTLGTLKGLGLVDDEAASRVPGLVRKAASLRDAAEGVDFVIEAVPEDLPLKQRVFADLDRHSPERTILASNTSSFMSSQLAPSTRRPDRVVVANWWNPPYLLPLVEVVRGPETSDETIETVTGLLERLGKRPVVLRKESLGFIGNRMQLALLREAIAVVEQGIASAVDVDVVVKSSFGRRLSVAGPFEVFDIAGWDTIRAIIDQLFPVIDASTETPGLVREMVDRGDLGLKTGRGFYRWTDEDAAALRSRISEALATIERLSRPS
jgi:3-hydroxyacyl-CoA dehydrogenase